MNIDDIIAEDPLKISIPSGTYTLYMKRGKNYYFRNGDFCVTIVTSDEDFFSLKKMRYGDTIGLSLDYGE